MASRKEEKKYCHEDGKFYFDNYASLAGCYQFHLEKFLMIFLCFEANHAGREFMLWRERVDVALTLTLNRFNMNCSINSLDSLFRCLEKTIEETFSK
jgi:hypothetical protein